MKIYLVHVLFLLTFLCSNNHIIAQTNQKGDSSKLVILCDSFNLLNNQIRDNRIKKSDALKQVSSLLHKIKGCYSSTDGNVVRHTNSVFPLEGYTYKAIGGKNGSGYLASGYDYFSGNKHGGHPAHDIFIKDINQDCMNDLTWTWVTVRSVGSGVVVATESNWQNGSTQRGGNYIWVYEPLTGKLIYYAHNSKVFVKPGDVIKPGEKIAFVGRTGFNAAKKRSPTHLHFMELLLDKEGYPRPINCYMQLLGSAKQ